MSKRTDFALLFASVASFFLVAITITAIVFKSIEPAIGISVYGIICGICFWTFLISGIVFQILLSKRMKRQRTKRHRFKSNTRKPQKIGLISVFKNPFGMASDIVFVLSLVIFIVAYWLTKGISIVCCISLPLSFFSFCTHCIFNGRNYYNLTNLENREDIQKK